MDSRRLHTRKVMNMNNKPKFAIRTGLAMALTLAIWSPLQAQKPPQAKSMMAAMAEKCQEMKLQKQKVRDDMKVQDARLTEELATMNRAPEAQKVGLMAATLTRMVEQRIAMDARKASMEASMMQHMMQHMQMGKETMSECPMMKGMKEMGDTSTGAHKEHKGAQK